MRYALTFPSGRMRLARAQSSGSEILSPIRSSGYTIDMHESDFSEATPRMSRANAVLHPGVPITIAPAGNISFEIETGQWLRLTQPEGEQVADFISFNRDDVRELLSMHSSRAVNLSWKLTVPHALYSNRTRQMWGVRP